MRPLKRACRAQDSGATRNGQAIAGVLIIHRIYFDLMIRIRTKKVARVKHGTNRTRSAPQAVETEHEPYASGGE